MEQQNVNLAQVLVKVAQQTTNLAQVLVKVAQQPELPLNTTRQSL
ncbi:hypothetical protein [Rossellomorea sp. y25]|nr:hypothetical protein [uncultured Rossellomorea sp.]